MGGTAGLLLAPCTWAKLSWLKPGVRIVRLVGFFLPLLTGSLRGEVGAERGCRLLPMPCDVVGLRSVGRSMSNVSFLTFLLFSVAVVVVVVIRSDFVSVILCSPMAMVSVGLGLAVYCRV